MLTHLLTRWTTVIAAVGLIATVASPVAAAPVPSSTTALKSAFTNRVSEVRWRVGGAVAAGVLGGLIIGSIIASAPYRYRGRAYYCSPGPVYAPGYYCYRD